MGVSKKRISVRAFVAGEFIPLDQLGGRPFRSNVKVGDKVEVGDLLSTMDIEAIRSAENVDITCALVFVNGTEKGAILEYEVFGRVKAGDIVCTVTLNEES